MSKVQAKTKLFFIDATNICYWKDTTTPTLTVLLHLLIVLKGEKKQNFYCIFDANTIYKIPDSERDTYKKILKDTKHFYQVTGGKRADDFLLELADSYQAPVISNDNYNDEKYDKYAWKSREFQPQRLFMGEVIPVQNVHHLILSELDIHVQLTQTADVLQKQLNKLLEPVTKRSGRIKFYNNQESWGRIFFEDDIYFNKKSFELNIGKKSNKDDQEIKEGLLVEFLVGRNEKGNYAQSITVLPEESKKFYTGTVEYYDEQKLLGAIKLDNTDKSLFFYKSYIAETTVSKFTKGQRVEFTLGNNKNGECAKNILLLKQNNDALQLTGKLKAAETDLKTAEEQIRELENMIKSRDNTIYQLRKSKKDGGQIEPPIPKPASKKVPPKQSSAENVEQQPSKNKDNKPRPSKPNKPTNNNKSDNKRTNNNQPSREGEQKGNKDNKSKRSVNNNNKSRNGKANNEEKKVAIANNNSKKTNSRNNNKPTAKTEVNKNNQKSQKATNNGVKEKKDSKTKTQQSPANKGGNNRNSNTQKNSPKTQTPEKKWIIIDPEPIVKTEPNKGTKEQPIKKEANNNKSKPQSNAKKTKQTNKVTTNGERKQAPSLTRDKKQQHKTQEKPQTTTNKSHRGKTPRNTENRSKTANKNEEQTNKTETAKSNKKAQLTTKVEGNAQKVDNTQRRNQRGTKTNTPPKKQQEQPSKEEQVVPKSEGQKRNLRGAKTNIPPKKQQEQPAREEQKKTEAVKRPAPSRKQQEPKVEVVEKKTDTTKPKKQSKTAKLKRQVLVAKTLDTSEKRTEWWKSLEPQWKKAFNVVAGNKEQVRQPSDAALQTIFKAKRLSFFRTSKNKLSFKLSNLSGVAALTNLTHINVSEHAIDTIKDVKNLKKLVYLGCNKNKLTKLENVDELESLKELNCNNNQITLDSFKRLDERLPKLQKLDCRDNALSEKDKEKVEKLLKIETVKV